MYDLILKKEKKKLNNDDDEILRKGGCVEWWMIKFERGCGWNWEKWVIFIDESWMGDDARELWEWGYNLNGLWDVKEKKVYEKWKVKVEVWKWMWKCESWKVKMNMKKLRLRSDEKWMEDWWLMVVLKEEWLRGW